VILATAVAGGVLFTLLAYLIVSSTESISFTLEHIIPLTPIVVTPSALTLETGSYNVVPDFLLYEYYVCEKAPPQSTQSSFNSSAVIDFTDHERSFTYHLMPYITYNVTISFNYTDLVALGNQATLSHFFLTYRREPAPFATWGDDLSGGEAVEALEADGEGEAAATPHGRLSREHRPESYVETQPLWKSHPIVTDDVCLFVLPPEFGTDCWPGYFCSVEIVLQKHPEDNFTAFESQSVRFVVSVSGMNPDVSQCRRLTGSKRERKDLPIQLRRRTDLYNINMQYTVLAKKGYFVGVRSDSAQYDIYGRTWGDDSENSLSFQVNGSITNSELTLLLVFLGVGFTVLLAFLLFLLLYEGPTPTSARVVEGLIRASQARDGRARSLQ